MYLDLSLANQGGHGVQPMNSRNFESIRALLDRCSEEEQKTLLRELRRLHPIHEYEQVIGAPAEMILEAIHRAPELTRRMLRGVIADAAFRTFVVPAVAPQGWRDITPQGNFAYDYLMEDTEGSISVQVKLQRSEKGAPVVKPGARFGFKGTVFMTETQKTRSGNDGDKETRPYRYGEFDVLAVSMQPSTGKWDRYMYTLGRWLLPGKRENEMATLQPVSMEPSKFWTDDFGTAARWLRAEDGGKRMALVARTKAGPRISRK